MRGSVVLIAALSLAALPAGASNAVSLGYSDETVTLGPGPDACAGGVLIHNDDGSFESAYAWAYGGVLPPYYGAWAEAYDLGTGMIRCGVYWLTTAGDFYPELPADCYVWQGGVGSDPGGVLGVVPGVQFEGIAFWPSVDQHDVEMNFAVAGPFTVGYWGSWVGWAEPDFYCAADLDGPLGHPWTCIAPGVGYPSGWQDPSIVWGPTSAMGCGVYFEQGTPAQGETWGALKTLFR